MKLTVSIASIFTLILLSLIVFPLNPEGRNDIVLFFGNFHPLILHIPIGALIGVLVLELVNLIKPQLNLDNGSKILLWFTAISVVPAVVFGFFLASSGGYNEEVLSFHKWLGLATALLCIWLLVFRLWAYTQSTKQIKVYQFLLLINVILLSFAGHYGGSLTHGSNYLTKDMPLGMKSFLGVEATEAERMVSSIKEQSAEGAISQLALTFADTIQPLMTKYCFDCHNANKQKGDIRLDILGWDMKKVEHVKHWRIALDEVVNRNMPPEDEKQLTEVERKNIIDWITNSLNEISPEIKDQEIKLAEEEKAKEEEALTMVLPKLDPNVKMPTQALKYVNDVQPILQKYCYECHGSSKQKGNIRLDILNWDMVHGGDAEKWYSALDEINAGQMPPKKQPQLTTEERRMVVDWVTNSLNLAADVKSATNKEVTRRLTKSQYTNSLNQLLDLPINFGNVLPDDGKSKMGFTNNGDILQISSLHIDYYQKIAREALNEAIVTGKKPETKKYKITFGAGIGEGKEAAEYGGYQSAAVKKEDFTVDVLSEQGENIDVDDTIKKLIGVDMRGSASDRYSIEKNGLVLYSALPHKDVPPKSWQGPSPNAKVLIKNNYPKSGNFVLRVEASKGNAITLKEGLIELRENKPAILSSETIHLLASDATQLTNLLLKDNVSLVPSQIDAFTSARYKLTIPSDGFYQVDFVHPFVAMENMPSFLLEIGTFNKIQERLKFSKEQENEQQIVTPVTLAYLKKGDYKLRIGGDFFVGFSEIRITPLDEDSELTKILKSEAAKNQEKYEDLIPSIKTFIGTRTDDGMDYSTFGPTKEVTSDVGDFKTFEFTGRLENLPVPVFDPVETEIFANTMIVGLWNNHLVKNKGENGPALLVKSIELEAPYHPVWPPKSHTTIFFDSPNKQNYEIYTAEVLKSFMEKAFRRPLIEGELERYMEFWKSTKDNFNSYEDSVKEVLVAILCSPNFLYLLESDNSKEKKSNDQYLLASKMAYFLWNSPPDDTLIELAEKGVLNKELSNEVSRMIKSPKILKMIEAFAYEWLRIDRLNGMSANMNMYPDFTRFVKQDMAKETYNFIYYVLDENKSILNFIDSDFAMLNQNLAEFYGIDGVIGNNFRPVSIPREKNRGGLLSQGAFLTGHSDGVHAHPIKRAVWLKEKILGDTPPPPPPNVPELDPETPGFENLTLKEQLELHRNKASCIDCHLKIDPYGVVFENYDAVGRFHEKFKGSLIDSKSILPDGTEVEGIKGIKEYILTKKKDAFTKSLVEHLFAYALGRDVSFSDEKELNTIVEKVKAKDFKFQSVIEEIILSESFSKHTNKVDNRLAKN
ncbi:hypothetical protein APS56_01015 [Pseudalgibacter alginicilyticus]|uniref:Cytochrome c domain-containing protein n=1 Tax=Pseudalgibacter alginicilyticus TaxID=1736674 RepID=A0A0N7HXZ3_9FLAO|nr:DUF1592 domain-containing protein [Pseudalgibacter alginicilyticus]ALJ03814.1 hypothetical protein APS56_01015 [Pseudalgibacter alginicilyticus]